MYRAERAGVLRSRFHLHDDAARLDGADGEADERGNGWRRQLAAVNHPDHVEHLAHAVCSYRHAPALMAAAVVTPKTMRAAAMAVKIPGSPQPSQ
jgi:hypothetical protein